MIEVIAYAISFLGILMLGILAYRLYQVDAELKLKKHRSKDAGLADLLVHASVVDDGVIVGKNGSLMASWLYRGEDNASSTQAQRELISIRINQAFVALGSGWMVHVDAPRHPAQNYSARELSHFSDPLSEAMDEERRQMFERMDTMYEGYFVLTLTYYPPLLAQQKFVEMMFDDDADVPDNKARTANLLEQFKRDCNSIEGSLSSVFKMTRLKGHLIENEDGSKVTFDDFLRWLQFCVTGINQPIILPKNPSFLDSVIGGQEFFGGVVPKIGRNYVQVVAIEGFPLESTPGILSALAELPSEYRWSSRFIFMDAHEAIQHLEKYRKKWKQKIRGFIDQVFNLQSGNIDQDAVSMVQDASDAIAEVNSGAIAQGYYTSVVVLMDEDRVRLADSARKIEKAIQRIGFAARVETINTMDAFMGSIPGHGVENVRRPMINTLNLADLLPTSTIWSGSATAPCNLYPPNSPPVMFGVTHGATPFRLNLHVGDVGHTFMFGPTGSGKSTHLALIAAQLRRYKGMSIFAFDKGMSMYPLAAGIRAASKGKTGLHFNVAADKETLAFCPLQFLETKSDRAWAMDWIEVILRLNDLVPTTSQRNAVADAILEMHEKQATTISEFCLTVQDNEIRDVLQQYREGNTVGHLLDAEKDGLSLSDFTVFEIEELMHMGDKYALPVLLYLFRRIERSLTGQPAVIILDEAWLMLGHDAFRAKIKEWLKVLRKANCLVLMATQSLSDAADSGILDVIVESTKTKIFLPNPNARDEKASALYEGMGLNKRQVEIIASAIQKQQYYLVSDEGRRLYELALGPLALAFVAASDKESVAAIQKLEDEFGHQWINHWLARRKISLNDYGVAQ